MIGLQTKAILGLVGAAAGASLAVGAWMHYTGLLDERTALRERVQALEGSLQIQRDTIEQAENTVVLWEQKYYRSQQRLARYVEVQEESREETARLRRLFADSDLERLGREKPILLEHALNTGSARINRLLECASSGGRDCPGETAATAGRDDPSEAGEADAR